MSETLNQKELKKQWTEKYELAIAVKLFGDPRDKDGKKMSWEQVARLFGVTSTAIRLKRQRKGREYFQAIYNNYIGGQPSI